MRTLKRPRNGRILAGVCAGIAQYFGIPKWAVRILWLILLLPGGFPGLIPYIICWIFIPSEK